MQEHPTVQIGSTWKKCNMSMMTGIVESVSTKDVNTKFGSKPTYSIKVNGAWVKCGFKDPKANVGDEIEFDGNTGTYGLETKAVTVLRKGSGVAPSAAAPSNAPAVTKSFGGGFKEKVFPIPALHGDRAIIRQNALARATDLFIAARGGKPFEIDEGLIHMVVNFARKFEAYTAGDLDLAEAMKEDAEEQG
jgi:hypothetical protein